MPGLHPPGCHNEQMRFFALLLLATACFAQSRDAAFSRLADRYFDEAVFRFDPVQATSAGFHQYDAQLPSGSKAEVQSEIAALRKFEAEVQAFDARGLSPAIAADRELVLSQIRGQLLALESIRMWQKNPDVYSSGATNAIFVIMSRSFAPPEARLRSAIAREKLIPRLLQSARENLSNPPRIYTEIALEQMSGIVSFFQNDVPAAFQKVYGSRAPLPIRRVQSGRDRCPESLRNLDEIRPPAALPRRFPHRRRQLPQEAALRRDGRYPARPPARHRL